MPFLALIVPDVPFVAACDPALMAPDEGLSIDELVDIEFQRLRCRQIRAEKIDVVNEIVSRRRDRVIRIENALRGKSPIRWLFQRTSEYCVWPPISNLIAEPLREGDVMPC